MSEIGENRGMATLGRTTPVQSAGNASIQILLDAEKEASARVNTARQYRVQRLKDARAEAEAEIEALKLAKKQELMAHEQQIVADLEASIKEQAKFTEEELTKTLRMAEENREIVLKLLVEKVLDVQPKIHPNALLRK